MNIKKTSFSSCDYFVENHTPKRRTTKDTESENYSVMYQSIRFYGIN